METTTVPEYRIEEDKIGRTKVWYVMRDQDACHFGYHVTEESAKAYLKVCEKNGY